MTLTSSEIAEQVVLVRIVEVIRLALSAHNAQPWRVEVSGSRRRIGWDPARNLDIADQEGAFPCYAFGCAIESALRVPNVHHDPSEISSPLESEWFAGSLELGASQGRRPKPGAGFVQNMTSYLAEQLDGEAVR